MAGVADAEAHPDIGVTDMGMQRPQAVVAGMAPAKLDPAFPGGEIQLVVENHKGVFECAPERIRLRTGEGILRIEGNNMALMEFSDERALIRGEISLVSFEK